SRPTLSKTSVKDSMLKPVKAAAGVKAAAVKTLAAQVQVAEKRKVKNSLGSKPGSSKTQRAIQRNVQTPKAGEQMHTPSIQAKTGEKGLKTPEIKSEKIKARDRRAREKALLKEAFSTHSSSSAVELEERRAKFRLLIKLAKERGFLTYSEINDHL